MDYVHRVIIHDKQPLVQADILHRPLNRAVLSVALLSVAVQAWAIAQVAAGYGIRTGVYDGLAFAVVAAMWLGLGVLVFLQRRSGYAGQVFLLSASAGSTFLSLGTLYKHVGYLDSLIFSAGLLLFPPLLLQFTRAFTEQRPWRRTELLLYIPAVALIWPGAQALYHQQTTSAWRLALSVVTLYLFLAITQTAREVAHSPAAPQAAQTRALLVGLIAGTIPGIWAFVLPLVARGSLNAPMVWLPPIVLLFLTAMGYSVLLFEFSEADLILRRGVIYGLLTVVIITVYGLFGLSLSAERTSVKTPGGGLAFVAVSIFVGAAFTPVRRLARWLVDWLLYGKPTDRWQLLQDLSARLSRVMQPDALGETLVREISAALHLQGAFLLERREDMFVVRHSSEFGNRLDEPANPFDGATFPEDGILPAIGDPPQAVLLLHSRPITAAKRSKVPAIYSVLDSLRVALAIPLVTRSGVEAILCLKHKVGHDGFDTDDLELLAPVIRQSSAALDNAHLFARLQEKVLELQGAYARIAREQESERARLSRELHDGTAQQLAGLITLAAVVERQLGRDGIDVRKTLETLKSQAEDAYQDVRRASHALRPLMLDDFGLEATLVRYLNQFQETTGIKVHFSGGEFEELPDDVELALFRVAQECLENVRKHSGATDATVTLAHLDGSVMLRVQDNGRGMGEGDRGIGLAGMRERVESVGGAICVKSNPGGGMTVQADIPFSIPLRNAL